jgi:hypothetical protein
MDRLSGGMLLAACVVQAPVGDMQDALGMGGARCAVGHHDNGGAAGMQPAQQVHDLLRVAGVQVAGGLLTMARSMAASSHSP